VATVLVLPHAEKIYRHYNSPNIAAYYGRQKYITPCERLLFSTYVRPGMAILDIGVGGGRTCEFLAGNAARYVGVDYAPEMVRVCRQKYPQWEYLEASATDLSPFQNESFDVVLMSYNMLDDLIPDESRWRCLQECHRVLREDGLLVFSSHNPRAILVRLDDEPAEIVQFAPLRGAFGRVGAVLHKALSPFVKVLGATCASVSRAFKYGTKSAFWRGKGYMADMEKLMTHFWVPKSVIAELGQYGFKFITLQGDDYPRKSHSLITEWYYYVLRKDKTAHAAP
jgi:ubiquinone/menaquinone biosynthesis C-methylase UbiE